MSVPVPNYLKHIGMIDKQQKTWTRFSIKCTCGCDKFFVYQNCLNKEEKALEKPYNDAIWEIYISDKPRKRTVDENGKVHYWRLFEPLKGLEGSHEELVIPDCPFFLMITVIKIKCADCEKEHIIFDNRIHGYDGMTGEHTQETLEYDPHFKLKCKDIVSLQIKIENDESFEEFQKNTNLGFSEKQYSDSFSWLVIYKIDEKGKKTKIFDWETA